MKLMLIKLLKYKFLVKKGGLVKLKLQNNAVCNFLFFIFAKHRDILQTVLNYFSSNLGKFFHSFLKFDSLQNTILFIFLITFL